MVLPALRATTVPEKAIGQKKGKFGIEVPFLREVILKTKYTKLKGEKSPQPITKSQSAILASFLAATKSYIRPIFSYQKTMEPNKKNDLNPMDSQIYASIALH